MSPAVGRSVAQTIAIALGSNLGDRSRQLARARERLAERIGPLQRISQTYETEPVGPAGQPRYLNQVVSLESASDAEDLLAILLDIERELGRKSRERWGPREIDLDLLLCGQEIRTTHRLELPHPRLHERAFVLVPLSEVLPDWRHPRLGLTVTEMLARVDRRGVTRWKGDAPEHGSS